MGEGSPPKFKKKEAPEVTKSFHNYMVKVSSLCLCYLCSFDSRF